MQGQNYFPRVSQRLNSKDRIRYSPVNFNEEYLLHTYYTNKIFVSLPDENRGYALRPSKWFFFNIIESENQFFEKQIFSHNV